jgi:hypothetical protein
LLARPQSLARTAALAHTLDETLQDREPVVPDLRVAEVDADDGSSSSATPSRRP